MTGGDNVLLNRVEIHSALTSVLSISNPYDSRLPMSTLKGRNSKIGDMFEPPMGKMVLLIHSETRSRLSNNLFHNSLRS